MPYKVLVSDKLDEEGLKVLRDEPEIELTVKTGMSPEELAAFIEPFHGIIIRSATRMTPEVIARAANLKVISRAGTGIDNVDVPSATRRGIIVMNTPGGNTVSTAEHAVAMLMALARHIYPACASLKGGKWDKKSFTGIELTGKTLGIVGVGRVGSEVAARAAGLQMKLVGYDPYFDRQRAQDLGVRMVDDLNGLLAEADFITVHTPLNDQTRNLVGAPQLARMKKGAGVVNCARGGIVDEHALAEAIKSGQVGGAALDVFEEEPPTNRTLIDLPQVVCTPHLAASTTEAQLVVAIAAARQLADALVRGEVRFALNMPSVEAEEARKLGPYLSLAERMGMLVSQLFTGPMRKVEARYSGEVTKLRLGPLTTGLTLGLLRPFTEANAVNMVNAPVLAAERGIEVQETRSSATTNFVTAVRVEVTGDNEVHSVTGTLFGRDRARVIEIDGFYLETAPFGNMLVIPNQDRPGVIGAIGRILGKHNINIANMANGRQEVGGHALTIVSVDSVPGAQVLDELRANPSILAVKLVRLDDQEKEPGL